MAVQPGHFWGCQACLRVDDLIFSGMATSSVTARDNENLSGSPVTSDLGKVGDDGHVRASMREGGEDETGPETREPCHVLEKCSVSGHAQNPGGPHRGRKSTAGPSVPWGGSVDRLVSTFLAGLYAPGGSRRGWEQEGGRGPR